MRKVHWTAKASETLWELLAPVAADDPRVAKKIATIIFAVAGRLAIFPRMGTAVPERADFYRLHIPRYPYTCYYSFSGHGDVYILLVRHEKRKPLH